MRDAALLLPEVPSEAGWNLDIDIVDGFLKLVPYESNTQDQRAALSAYMIKGTIPGKPTIGIGWSELYDNDEETLITIDNEIRQFMKQNAGLVEGPTGAYTPEYKIEGDSIGIGIYRG